MKSLSSRSPYSTQRKVTVAVVIALALIGVGVALYLYSSGQQNTDKNTTDPTNTNAKKDAAAQDAQDNNSKSSTTINSGQVPVSQNLSVTLAPPSQSEGFVRASAQTSGSGTCVFSYQPADGGKVVKSDNVSVDNNSCSVNISQNDFTYLGQWKLTVTYYSNNAKAEASQNVTIN